jgi:hypothetical protein
MSNYNPGLVDGDPRIKDQKTGRALNPDITDLSVRKEDHDGKDAVRASADGVLPGKRGSAGLTQACVHVFACRRRKGIADDRPSFER